MMENILIKLRRSSTKSAILSKTELMLDPSVEALKILMYLRKKPPRRRLLFSKVAGLEFLSCNLIKKELHHKDSSEISFPSNF